MGSGASNVKIQQSPSPTDSSTGFPVISKSGTHGDGKTSYLNKKIDKPSSKNRTDSLNISEKEPLSNGPQRGFDGSHGPLPPIPKSSNTATSVSPIHQLSSSKLKAGSFKAGDADRSRQLEEELAVSESQRLDLQEQCQMLQERLGSLEQSGSPKTGQDAAELNETIHAKDQYIVKLEKDLKTLQTESSAIRLKLKKRIKNLTSQLHEVRQEASINQMELKQEIAQNLEKIKELSSNSCSKSSAVSEDTTSHSKLIVELSNQLSEQEERIASLEAAIVEKDLTIERLESKAKKTHTSSQRETDEAIEGPTGDRLHSSRGSRTSSNATSVRFGTAESKSSTLTRSLTRQSTALSDSDSDWDASEMASQTHSAPARVRVKSAQSIQSISKRATAAESVQGDDDSVLQYLNNSEMNENSSHSGSRVRPQRKSALKNHLERQKVENQTGSLMGPSLAFASHMKEPVSDTSCEPTPRNYDPSKLPGFSKLTVINQTHY